MCDTAADPFVSVVVPLVHEWGALADRLRELAPASADLEVCVAAPAAAPAAVLDGLPPGLRVSLRTSERGRGIQQNTGAAAAHGRWLLFLHVDTQLPGAWVDELRRIDGDAGVVAGSFRFGLDSAAWQARLLERVVRWRVWLLDLPYGDQALFVRRAVFEALGGFSAIPLMEDVELVGRLRQRGRLWHSPLAVRTSAARWERDGWVARSAANLTLLLRYQLGADPHVLARAYAGPVEDRHPHARPLS